MTGITGTAHIIGAYIYTHVDNSRTHRLKWEGRRKFKHNYNSYTINHITMSQNVEKLLTVS